MSKKTYKVKEQYIDASICPNVIVIKLADLRQDQILKLIDSGFDMYFEEVKTKKKAK